MYNVDDNKLDNYSIAWWDFVYYRAYNTAEDLLLHRWGYSELKSSATYYKYNTVITNIGDV